MKYIISGLLVIAFALVLYTYFHLDKKKSAHSKILNDINELQREKTDLIFLLITAIKTINYFESSRVNPLEMALISYQKDLLSIKETELIKIESKIDNDLTAFHETIKNDVLLRNSVLVDSAFYDIIHINEKIGFAIEFYSNASQDYEQALRSFPGIIFKYGFKLLKLLPFK